MNTLLVTLLQLPVSARVTRYAAVRVFGYGLLAYATTFAMLASSPQLQGDSALVFVVVLDFRPAATACGIEVPLMTGRDMITSIIMNPSTRIDTTHVVTNPRVQITGYTATMTALVEAQHLSTGDHTRHALLKNIFSVEALRDGDGWRMSNVLIRNVWRTGDPNVVTGN